MTQLAGHPVIYDILPQTGRFSKIVLTNPDCARWFDTNALISELTKHVDEAAAKLKDKYSKMTWILSAEFIKKPSRVKVSVN